MSPPPPPPRGTWFFINFDEILHPFQLSGAFYTRKKTKIGELPAAVIRIRDILERIRILGSVPLTSWSGTATDPDHALSSVTFKMQIFFWFITFWRYIYIILHRWKIIKKSQNSRIKGFLTIFAWWWKDPDPESLELKNPENWSTESDKKLRQG